MTLSRSKQSAVCSSQKISPVHTGELNTVDFAESRLLSTDAIVTYNGGLDPLVANDFNFI